MSRIVEIRVRGEAKTGKSTILKALRRALKEAGVEEHAYLEDAHVLAVRQPSPEALAILRERA